MRTLVLTVAVATLSMGCGAHLPPLTFTLPPLQTLPVGQPAAVDRSVEFGRLFCSVLAHVSVDEPWGTCASYFDPAGSVSALPELAPGHYRILVVPGIFGQCVESLARPFADAHVHLARAHGISTEYLSVTALGSSAYNARQIADYLTSQFTASDARPYVVFGYSKGAADVLQAVSDHDIARRAVAALVTVAGSVMGSPLADGVPDVLGLLKASKIGDCQVGDKGAITSLGRKERVETMKTFRWPPGFRVYSIPSVSTYSTTSAVLRAAWRRLSVLSLDQDSQMVRGDAVAPGADYLGTALADHWAVALPFEDVTDPNLGPIVRRLVDRNTYPREALFEAALRWALAGLPRPVPAPTPAAKHHAFGNVEVAES